MKITILKLRLGFNNNRIKGEDSVSKLLFKPSPPPPMLSADVCSGSFVVDSILIVAPIVCEGFVFGPCL